MAVGLKLRKKEFDKITRINEFWQWNKFVAPAEHNDRILTLRTLSRSHLRNRMKE